MNKLFLRDFPFFMAMPAVAWQIVFFYIPLFIVFLYSLVKMSSGVLHVTLEHYIYFLRPLFLLVIGHSLLLALVTAVLCLLFAYPIAYCLAVRVTRFKNLLLFFLILPFWTSLMVQVYSWFFILEHNGLINSALIKIGLIKTPIHLLNTPFAVYLVMVYCYLPFMIMPLYSALEKIDRRMFEASADLAQANGKRLKMLLSHFQCRAFRPAFF